MCMLSPQMAGPHPSPHLLTHKPARARLEERDGLTWEGSRGLGSGFWSRIAWEFCPSHLWAALPCAGL